mmetsp:Transcript_90013/g.263126  ORF Transcript_90013/g.263126 Transcript_90013/m.263126 type:complete len:275 (+) Transcript_90013:679-1503(+)
MRAPDGPSLPLHLQLCRIQQPQVLPPTGGLHHGGLPRRLPDHAARVLLLHRRGLEPPAGRPAADLRDMGLLDFLPSRRLPHLHPHADGARAPHACLPEPDLHRRQLHEHAQPLRPGRHPRQSAADLWCLRPRLVLPRATRPAHERRHLLRQGRRARPGHGDVVRRAGGAGPGEADGEGVAHEVRGEEEAAGSAQRPGCHGLSEGGCGAAGRDLSVVEEYCAVTLGRAFLIQRSLRHCGAAGMTAVQLASCSRQSAGRRECTLACPDVPVYATCL